MRKKGGRRSCISNEQSSQTASDVMTRFCGYSRRVLMPPHLLLDLPGALVVLTLLLLLMILLLLILRLLILLVLLLKLVARVPLLHLGPLKIAVHLLLRRLRLFLLLLLLLRVRLRGH